MADDNTPLPRLKDLERDVAEQNGIWNAGALHYSIRNALQVAGPAGTPSTLDELAADHARAEQHLDAALLAVGRLRRTTLPTIWAGDTQGAAGDALAAAERGLERGVEVLGKVAQGLRGLADAIEGGKSRDTAALAPLREAYELTEEITAGPFIDPLNYDGDTMHRAHQLAKGGMAERVAAHTGVAEASREASSTFHDLASQARLQRLADSPLSALDELLLADAGSTGDGVDTAILSAAMADRAADRLAGMSEADRARLEQLLGSAGSPEHRAYLMRALAAGYDIDRISEFNRLIGPYGDDPAWLREHLNPLGAGGPSSGGQQPTTFDGVEWTQGQYPTCVASSTVTARAAVDPLYALQLTTGGHPGDPAYDNGAAFAERLRDEQVRVYGGERSWVQDLPVLGSDGMTNDQSETIADQEIGARTGADYQNRDVDNSDERRAVLPEIERAVDEGHAVPFSSHDDSGGHQMLIIGHEGDKLQVYNPWGYTVWVDSDDFVNGRLDSIGNGVPTEFTSVRLPG
ncbi:hypothetical protein O7626_06335 [Micromonospora sp. WMMD1102]|uniref:hypothetical protein n=1 Tax=Micromonospora sp. WMMD1102 TaxID=3016105 RepID=UPI002415726C|nr:hypothetical protein [Micromonospora sp. WMMD1102]MDG4785554.1 hypothetical protein [Micromonospora sp. WMMD1102]